MRRCLSLLMIAGLVGCPRASDSEPTAAAKGAAIELDGAWFVLYADDPRPYLDVAFTDGSATPARAWATLTHHTPSAQERRFELHWNAEDAEWQADCSDLGPLGPSIHYIPSVEVEAKDGTRTTWTADGPWSPYAGTEVGAGFFYVPGPEQPRVRIETAAVPGKPPADTVIFVFEGDDLGRWIAAADDPITTSPFAILEAVLTPGRYTIRVDGSEDAGSYTIKLGDGGEAGAPESEPDRPDSATPLEPGRTYTRTVGGDDPSDWFVLEVTAD